jgi:5-methyltetrahydrofolate--homocysteine methyltransferase
VVDLGKQVPAETIISRAVEEKADAIGLSALLVSTSKQMPLVVNELQRRGLNFPVLIGGAAINERFGRRILRTEENALYEPGVFYCKDAFEGLSTMDALSNPGTRQAALEKLKQDSDFEYKRSEAEKPGKSEVKSRSSIQPSETIPSVPGWGARVVQQMPLEMVFKHLAKNELFRLSWGARNTHGDDWKKLQAEYEERLLRMSKEALQDKWLQPRGVYGYWPAQSEGDNLLVYDPASIEAGKPQEITRFHFPRQNGAESLSLADYFQPVQSGKMDVVASRW